MTLSWGVVVVEALWSMKPMKDLRGSAVDRVALCGEAEGGARNFGEGGSKGADALEKRRQPLYASWTACCGDGEMRAQVFVISGWVVLDVCGRPL